jgi:NAD(P)H dehydrogenase (quinone)
MSMPSILVLGAIGKIGGALVNELFREHATGRLKLVAAVRRAEAARLFEERGIETRQLDLDTASSSIRLSQNAESVALATSSKSPKLTFL